MPLRLLILIAVAPLVGCGGGSDGTSTPDGAVDGGVHDLAVPDLPGPDVGCTTDADGDGHTAMACGGDDCDDTDPHRYPTNPETCDAAGHDEDCMAATLGPDGDGDGFVSTMCCNRQPSGGMTCGDDCDDTRATVSPSALESCNGADDNCSGAADEGLGARYFPDCDGDGFGDDAASADAMCSLSAPTLIPPTCHVGDSGLWATRGGDCDDHAAGRHPLVPETCDGVDEDCNGTVDDATATDAWCTDSTHVPAHAATATCTSGACAAATCDASFLDCTTAPGCETDSRSSASSCGTCGHSCTFVCAASTCEDAAQISVGDFYACSRQTSGSVTCWGDNMYGQLGDGSAPTSQYAAPVLATGLAGATYISAGDRNTCAVVAGGTVKCWGTATGDGLSSHPGCPMGGCAITPVTVASLTDAVEVESGNDRACAVRSGGGVSCWDASGSAPAPVAGVTNGAHLALGSTHACAIRTDRSVVCWGENSSGQLGDGTLVPSATPVVVAGLPDAISIAAAYNATCAVRATGAVMCWGGNVDGILGDGTMTNRSSPVVVSGITDAVEVDLGGYHACARRSSGAVACWGLNNLGALGDGTMTTSLVPVAVVGLTDATSISVGGYHVCAIEATGALSCWGQISLAPAALVPVRVWGP